MLLNEINAWSQKEDGKQTVEELEILLRFRLECTRSEFTLKKMDERLEVPKQLYILMNRS